MRTDVPKELTEHINKTRNICNYLESELRNQKEKLIMLVKTRRELYKLKGGINK